MCSNIRKIYLSFGYLTVSITQQYDKQSQVSIKVKQILRIQYDKLVGKMFKN